MAGLIFNVKTEAETALTAATVKTVLQVDTPTNQRAKLLQWGVYFDGTSATAEPVVVQLCLQNAAITGTACTEQENHPADETIQTIGLYNATVEPTTNTLIKSVNVHPQSGYESQSPFGQEYIIAGNSFLGIRCTAPAGVNVHAWMLLEE